MVSMFPLQPPKKKKGKGKKGKGKGKAKASAIIDGLSTEDMTKEQVGLIYYSGVAEV